MHASGGRNTVIDFWRGLVLVIIFVNHVPGNILEHLTRRNYGFSDAAEAFVFISGLSVALVYFPKLAQAACSILSGDASGARSSSIACT